MPTKATSRQLAYLKTLADQRGQSFRYPSTTEEASQEIRRLKRIRPDSTADQRRERRLIAGQIHAGPSDAAARVHASEVGGYGAQARWNGIDAPYDGAEGPEARPAPRPTVGQRVELGAYQLPGGERRRIIGQRVNGIVRISDVPDEGTKGRAYLIERELESNAELQAVLIDYLARASELRAIPMSLVQFEPGV